VLRIACVLLPWMQSRDTFIADLAQRAMWGIAITWRPSVVRPLTFSYFNLLLQLGQIGTKLGRKHLCKVLYKASSFRPVSSTNMAAKGNSCFWLATVKKIFSSETAWPNGTKLGRKHLCKILYKASSFGSIRPTNMATESNSCFLSNFQNFNTSRPLFQKH